LDIHFPQALEKHRRVNVFFSDKKPSLCDAYERRDTVNMVVLLSGLEMKRELRKRRRRLKESKLCLGLAGRRRRKRREASKRVWILKGSRRCLERVLRVVLTEPTTGPNHHLKASEDGSIYSA
jgi:hypothetical protein